MTDKVLDFVGRREQNIEDKRRNFERILFQNFLGAYSVIDQAGTLYPVSLIDISNEGCLFQIPWNVRADKELEEGSVHGLRIYFTKQSFLPTEVKVKYSKEFVDSNGDTFMQYGCEFNQDTCSFEALQKFIEFMYKFAEHSSIDRGDQISYFL